MTPDPSRPEDPEVTAMIERGTVKDPKIARLIVQGQREAPDWKAKLAARRAEAAQRADQLWSDDDMWDDL